MTGWAVATILGLSLLVVSESRFSKSDAENFIEKSFVLQHENVKETPDHENIKEIPDHENIKETSDHENIKETPDYGEPLYITPYLLARKVDQARKLSRVQNLPNAPDIESYSGFLTVNGFYNSNMFFWFFPALDGNKSAPFLLWLQGGPGASGLFGLFVEHGPYQLHANLSATIRPYSYASKYNVLYLDSPVGTGFSYTDVEKGYARNQEMIAGDLYEFLQQFFFLFKEYRQNPFYIAGENYAGKYVPALAYYIHNSGPQARINLEGIVVGNGMCDPENMLDYADFFYQLGLVDRKQAAFLKKVSKSIKKNIKQKKYREALSLLNLLIVDIDAKNPTSYFQNLTGYDFAFNLIQSEVPKEFNGFEDYLALPQFRKSVHVGNLTFNSFQVVQRYLLDDIMLPVREEMVAALDNYRVLVYNGQLDLLIPYPLTINFLQNLKWVYAEAYKMADRQIWRVNGTVAGYVHQVKDFYEVLVRDAGHILAFDNPRFAFDMMDRFLSRKSFQ